jgi:hypothetical protein
MLFVIRNGPALTVIDEVQFANRSKLASVNPITKRRFEDVNKRCATVWRQNQGDQMSF